MAAIFSLSAQSSLALPYLPYWVGGEDFFLHMAEYGVLGLLLSWALVNSGVVGKLVLYVFLIGLFYGMTDELHQYFVPGRVASLLDLTADGLGSLLGSYSFRMICSIKSTI
jgi:VanZ family protein